MRRPLAVLLCALAMAGCVAHEKSGDSAAAVGDWKAAYGHYRQALADKPETPGLKEKHDRARDMALADAWNRAQGCERTQDWGCVLGETDYMLSIQPNHPDAISARSRAAVQQGYAQVALARTEVSQRHYREALDRLNAVRKLTGDPGVNQQAAAVQQELVSVASRDAEQRWYERNYDEALAIYQLLEGIDPRYREQVRRVTEDRERAIVARYEEQARRGDELLSRFDFRGANQAYVAAEQVRAGGRAKAMVPYTQHLITADDFIKAGNYAACEQSLRSAIATGQDRGLAADMLDRVAVKPYRVAIRSVLLQPTRPGGDAWVGNTSGLYFRIAQQIDKALDRRQYDRAIDTAQNVPYENRPNLKIEAMLPDGTRLQTSARSGLYAAFDGEFIVAANQFDERRIVFRVFQEKNNEEVGRVEAPLRDLLGAREVALDSQTLAQLRLSVAGAQGRQPGSFINLVRIDTPSTNTGTATAGGPVAPTGPGPAAGPGQPPAGHPSNTPGGNAVPATGTSGGQVAPAGSSGGGSVQPAGGTGVSPGSTGAASGTGSTTPASSGGTSGTVGSSGPGNSGNAPGQTGGSPGNSGNAPGHSGGSPGNSGNAPGHSGGSPGNSGNAPGQSGGTPPGLGGGAPGNSGNAPGHSGTVGGGTPGNSGGGQGQGGNPNDQGSGAPGNSGGQAGNSGGAPGNSGGQAGNSGGAPGNSGGQGNSGGGNSGGGNSGGGNSGGNGNGGPGVGSGSGSPGNGGGNAENDDDQGDDDKKKKKRPVRNRGVGAR